MIQETNDVGQLTKDKDQKYSSFEWNKEVWFSEIFRISQTREESLNKPTSVLKQKKNYSNNIALTCFNVILQVKYDEF